MVAPSTKPGAYDKTTHDYVQWHCILTIITININKENKLKFAKINPELKYKIFLSTTACSTFILQGSIFADGACSAKISSSKKKTQN